MKKNSISIQSPSRLLPLSSLSSQPPSSASSVRGRCGAAHAAPSAVPSTTPPKSSPGRRRSEASHQAILKATAELLGDVGYVGMSVEAIARRASVGKQTIYRWWPSKAEVVLELCRCRVEQSLCAPDTGNVQNDLRLWVEQWVTLLTTAAFAQALAGIAVEAQASPALAQKFSEQIVSYRRRCIYAILQRGIDRGELRDDLQLEMTADLIDAPVWYRLLLGAASFSSQFSSQLIDEIMLGLQAFEEDLVAD